MLIAKIIDTKTGREELLMQRHQWYTCPYVLGYKPACAYYESRLELFMFACDVSDIDCNAAEWVDGSTGEILTFWDLCDEESEIFEMEA